MRVEVDPKSGVKVLTSTLEVTREEVKEYSNMALHVILIG
jgi:hypothetical protein